MRCWRRIRDPVLTFKSPIKLIRLAAGSPLVRVESFSEGRPHVFVLPHVGQFLPYRIRGDTREPHGFLQSAGDERLPRPGKSAYQDETGSFGR